MSDYPPRIQLNRKRKTLDPCEGCGLHRDRCICHLIPRLELKTKVCLVIHHRELKRTTNTGMLALKALTNSACRIRGELNQPLNLSDLIAPEFRSVLFFPCVRAIELTREFVQESPLPIQLIVPDGNWRQASKVLSRHKELSELPQVKLSGPNLSKNHLRAEHFPEGLSTLEAIANALGIIEGPEIQNSLLLLYQAKLRETLRGRGCSTEL